MRLLLLTITLAALVFGAAPAPAATFPLDGLFGTHHKPVRHRARPAKPATKPAPKPAKPAAAATKPADTATPAKPAEAPAPVPATKPEAVEAKQEATSAASQAQPADAATAKPDAAETKPDTAGVKPEAADAAAAGAPGPDAAATPPLPLPRPADQAKPAAEAAAPAETAAPSTSEAAAPATTATTAPSQPSTSTAEEGQATTPAEGETATPKPPRVYQTACPAVISGLVDAKPLPPIIEGPCQEQSPLSVTAIEVNGRSVPLSTPATFNCQMATDLPPWVADVDNYIYATQKTRVKSVIVGGTYECRPRNVEGGSSDLSEHGRADAIDFIGFTLEDGRSLTVTADYNSADATINQLMHFAHDAACTRFTTVLGPDANALHHDHFHLDLGCHGKTCTYRLCE